MDLRFGKPKGTRFHETVKHILALALPLAAKIGLLTLFVAYLLGSVFSPINDWLVSKSRVVIAAAFGLGWLAFTTLLSVETRSPATSGSRILPSDRLGEELQSLTDERKLELDIFAYSGETFRGPLIALLKALMRSDHPPQAITIRVLLKDWESTSFLPGCSKQASADIQDQRSRYRHRTKEAHQYINDQLLTGIEECREKLKFTFSVRAYHIDPFHKGILINGRRGFWSLYSIKPILADCPSILDYEGKEVTFSEFRHDETPSEALALRSMYEWFNIVWAHCSSDFPPPSLPSGIKIEA